MERVHADLPAVTFTQPEGIVEAIVCSISGKQPNPDGSCNAHVMQEYYAEGTEPLELCDVHYTGQVCGYEGTMACAECPFQYYGTAILTPIEDESLHFGASYPIELPDGTIIYNQPRLSNYCQHDALFLLQPNAEELIYHMWYEIQLRNEAAAAAAAAAQPAQ